MLLLVCALILVCTIGYLAQTTGLCMVRGVNEWKNGNPAFLLAILLSGVLAWVAGLFSYLLNIPLTVNTYAASVWFAIGGIIFGLGTSLNNGCGVSTLSKLSRGDLKMIATIIGWLVGWTILSYWQPGIDIIEISLPTNVIYGVLLFTSIVIVIWALKGDKARKKLWFSMLGIGLLAGFLFLYERHWTPSGLLQHLSGAMLNGDTHVWPSIERYLLFFALLAGMFIAAWRSKTFDIQLGNLRLWFVHIIAGTLMGIGASLAMGGNDSQLLIALPTLSPAGVVAVVGMIVGIRLGLSIKSLSK
ncbi:YeeE/YedE thiosulfate transporter family protein [Thalassotalea sp. ND16A]|uniref:YeeE/YedE thiosulfate transporter family protein n=1 Tax=Thalassotalea sp. ND16A TaxID=1535422 RepID=UPI00051A2A64|nr:YeeE/YedE thiosulfate transporter family protein [Thalassotalea sp. ND16A]KGJ90475.1 hypothetical protein ND16A_1871 [Thalassotalea sp. ND16A]